MILKLASHPWEIPFRDVLLCHINNSDRALWSCFSKVTECVISCFPRNNEGKEDVREFLVSSVGKGTEVDAT